jgi:hypothetical protein
MAVYFQVIEKEGKDLKDYQIWYGGRPAGTGDVCLMTHPQFFPCRVFLDKKISYA